MVVLFTVNLKILDDYHPGTRDNFKDIETNSILRTLSATQGRLISTLKFEYFLTSLSSLIITVLLIIVILLYNELTF